VEEAEVEVEEVEEEEEDQYSQPLPPMEMENWRARNPPSSLVIEQEPMSSCMNSNSTNSSIRTPRS
jgi:hypothetical protein